MHFDVHANYWHHAELQIGFINTPYQANEIDGFATVEFGILNNGVQLGTEVRVELFFSELLDRAFDRTAMGKFCMQQCCKN